MRRLLGWGLVVAGGADLILGALGHGILHHGSSVPAEQVGPTALAMAEVISILQPFGWAFACLAVCLVLVGAGMVRGETWVRRAARAWSWVALVVLLGWVFVQIRVVWPRMDALAAIAAERGLGQRRLDEIASVKYAALPATLVRALLPAFLLGVTRRTRRRS